MYRDRIPRRNSTSCLDNRAALPQWLGSPSSRIPDRCPSQCAKKFESSVCACSCRSLPDADSRNSRLSIDRPWFVSFSSYPVCLLNVAFTPKDGPGRPILQRAGRHDETIRKRREQEGPASHRCSSSNHACCKCRKLLPKKPARTDGLCANE